MNELLYQINQHMFFKINENNSYALEKPPQKILKNIESTKNIFFPKEKDKLFWCFLILRYGLKYYNSILHHHFKIEKKEKEKCIDLLRENKSKIKQRKLKFDENILLYDNCITLEMFFSLCCACNINVIFCRNKTFFPLIDNTEKEIKYIYKHDKIGYGIKEKQIDNLSNTHIQSVSLTKHLKSISSYRLPEIKNMCNKLNIPTTNFAGKPVTKLELYNKIFNTIN